MNTKLWGEPYSKQPKLISVLFAFRFKNYPKQLTETTFSDFGETACGH